METKPGKRPLVPIGWAGMAVRRSFPLLRGDVFGVIFVRDVGKGFLSISEHPSGIVKLRICGCRVSRDSNPPVLIEQNRGTNAGGIKDYLRRGGSIRRRWRSMAVCSKELFNRRRWYRMWLLGNKIRPRRQDRASHSTRNQCDCKDRSAQVSSRKPRAHHCNSDGWKFQEEGLVRKGSSFSGRG